MHARSVYGILLILLMKRVERASGLTRFFYVYIMKVVSLDRSFVLNSCNSQYNQFYCFNYSQTSVYSSKEFVTLVYLCLYLVLLLEQPLHAYALHMLQKHLYASVLVYYIKKLYV